MADVNGTESSDTLVGTTANDRIFGRGGNDTLSGGLGNDFLSGGTGSDLMNGGGGNDSYIVDALGDQVNEQVNGLDQGGIDSVSSSVSFTLGSFLENLTLTGTAARGTGNDLANTITGTTGANILSGMAGDDTISGGAGNDTMSGGIGNDTLSGGTGADSMNGGAGNDSYVVDAAGDQATETVNGVDQGGADRVSSSISFTLGAFIEDLTLTGAGAIDGTGNTLANQIAGNSGVNKLQGMDGNDLLFGGSGNDTLEGGAGNDSLAGGIGADAMSGGAGDDTYTVDAVGDTVDELLNGVDQGGTDRVNSYVTFHLGASLENLTLMGAGAVNGTGNILANEISGNSNGNILLGDAGNDKLSGAGGNDTLTGGIGADVMSGGAGNDIYNVDSVGDTASELLNGVDQGGTDLVNSSVTFELGAGIENLMLTGSAVAGTGNAAANQITGNAANNSLSGAAGNDTLRGKAGQDTLDGGAGADLMYGGGDDDSYVVDSSADKALEDINGVDQGGTDSVTSSVSFTLGAFVENLTLSGLAAINGTGNALANTIVGNAAANVLSGGAGNDTMQGGDGNDTYVVDAALDVVEEIVGGVDQGGIDRVNSSISYALGGALENLTLIGTALNGTGNALANDIVGNASANILLGGDANDTLSGGRGNDTLNGQVGADQMAGGRDNDIYVVDNVGDVTTEVVNNVDTGGVDRVESSVTFALAAGIEHLKLTGTAAINGTGNNIGNEITGNDAANTLAGGAGSDNLSGGVGNDVLNGDEDGDVLAGGDGNDTLRGGVGSDAMAGGAGDDTYFVDVVGDQVSEKVGLVDQGGVDTVSSTISYELQDFVEKLILTDAALNGTGNGLNNEITGNDLANTLLGRGGNDTLLGGLGKDKLDGEAGVDTMKGGGGDDSYFVDISTDKVIEDEAGFDQGGTDSVTSSASFALGLFVENLTLTGALALNGTGNATANAITGNAGNNTLSGVAGNDTLVGGSGDDLLNGGADADRMEGGANNDTYEVDNIGDNVVETMQGGTMDLVNSSIDYVLGSYVENLTLTGSALNGTGNGVANKITGNSANNTLTGNGGDDELSGGAGQDMMIGGDGSDTYIVDDVNDQASETKSTSIGGNDDQVNSSVTFTIGANIEHLLLTGALAINGTGNGLDNDLTGNSGINTLYGLVGDDRLNGGLGADLMHGGAGDDTYVVNTGADQVIEQAAGTGVDEGGSDTVESFVTYTLGAFVEDLTLMGVAAISGTGNALVNAIQGNSGNNTLNGMAGNDTLRGGAGVDILNGGADADFLDGEAGADQMLGGLGNDDYQVDDVNDTVIEDGSDQGGSDEVESTVSFTLGNFVEDLTLEGDQAIDGTGNGLGNSIDGNSGANTLTGNAGADILFGFFGNDTLLGGADNDRLNGGGDADIMRGGAGDDTYIVDNASDQAFEFENLVDQGGVDTVESSVSFTLADGIEDLLLTTGATNGTGNGLANVINGNGSDNYLSGMGGADELFGKGGNDTLRGGDGVDILVGGSGADRFVVAGPTSSGSQDRIADFSDEDFVGVLNGEYNIGAGPIRFIANETGTATAVGTSQFVFDTDDFTLTWDSNGTASGGVVQLAVFETAVVLSAADFIIL
jgi:Ca2+-binding RTX toxin-like protein